MRGGGLHLAWGCGGLLHLASCCLARLPAPPPPSGGGRFPFPREKGSEKGSQKTCEGCAGKPDFSQKSGFKSGCLWLQLAQDNILVKGRMLVLSFVFPLPLSFPPLFFLSPSSPPPQASSLSFPLFSSPLSSLSFLFFSSPSLLFLFFPSPPSSLLFLVCVCVGVFMMLSWACVCGGGGGVGRSCDTILSALFFCCFALVGWGGAHLSYYLVCVRVGVLGGGFCGAILGVCVCVGGWVGPYL